MEREPTVREDLGYNTKSSPVLVFRKYQNRTANGTLNVSRKLPEDRIRIEYIQGMMAGRVVVMAKRYADPVIKRGYARKI